MIPQTTELSQIQAAFIDKDNRIEELMRQINSAQSLLNSLKDTMNSLVGDGKITIQTYTGSNVGDFTVNQKENKTITLPQQATVNNGTLTIQKNGTTVGTFTANQSEDTTTNITVPTKTSEITNDSGFVTSNDVLLKANNLSDLNNKSTAMTNVIDSYSVANDADVNSDNIEFMGRKSVNNVFTWYKIKFSSFWNYIQGKISSVLGLTLTNYSGKAATAGTADKVANAITFSNDGTGAASGSTFDGSAARKLSWNSIGACPDSSELMFCIAESFTQDNVTHLRIKAQGHISSLVNDKYYYIATPRYAINNTANSGYFYLNINNLGDKLLRFGNAQTGDNIITRQFSLPQGIYTVRYSSSDNSFYLYFDESLNGRMFQRYGTTYVTCFGRSDTDGYYVVRRLNSISNTITLAFTGADSYGYGLVNNVKVDGWSSADTTFIMFYNHTDKTLTNIQKLDFNYSYIVDSNQKLADWANNVAGNDYTSVLIKKGTWTYSGVDGINLTATGTKSIIGETGAILSFSISTNQKSALFYEAIPTTNDYFIKNITIKTTRHDNHCLNNCINIYNSIVLAGNSSVAFLNCYNIIDCSGSGTYAVSHCVGMRNVTIYKGSGSIGYQRGLNDCYLVSDCKVIDDIPNAYYQSYSSPTADATYACANTLNGGWNTTV
jgi:hypothetical protein